MIKHIVMWKIKDFAENRSKKENLKMFKSLLEGLKEKIPHIKSLEVGINLKTEDPFNSDISLYCEFESEENLQKYLDHPEHKKVAEFIAKIRIERRAVDYIPKK